MTNIFFQPVASWQSNDYVTEKLDLIPNFEYKITTDYNNSDICITHDWFNFKSIKSKLNKNKKYIHITDENILYWDHYNESVKFINFLHNNNYNINVIGSYYNPNWKSIYFPQSYFNIYENYNKDNFEERYINNVCHLYNAKYNHRNKIINFYNSKNLKQNNTFINNKIKACENYLFNIAVENSQSKFSGYITEKISDAIMAGCIPIYWGGNLKKFTPFNLDRIITIDDLNKFPKLNTDKIYLKDKFDLPVLNNNYNEYQEIIKNQIIKAFTS